MPAIFQWPEAAEADSLAAYGPRITDMPWRVFATIRARSRYTHSFDHLIGARNQTSRYFQSDRLAAGDPQQSSA
jgi:hypothetical protein